MNRAECSGAGAGDVIGEWLAARGSKQGRLVIPPSPSDPTCRPLILPCGGAGDRRDEHRAQSFSFSRHLAAANGAARRADLLGDDPIPFSRALEAANRIDRFESGRADGVACGQKDPATAIRVEAAKIPDRAVSGLGLSLSLVLPPIEETRPLQAKPLEPQGGGRCLGRLIDVLA